MIDIKCPSGLSGSVRGMKVKELGDMADVKLLRSGKIIDKLVSNCWLKTTAIGPYPYEGDKLPWDSMLQGDRAWAFLQVRAATFGDDFAFEHTCSNTMCKYKYEATVKLSDLQQKALPTSSYTHVKTGVPLSLMVAGKKVSFRLLKCSDDQRLSQLQQNSGLSFPLAQIVSRITEIEGIPDSDLDAMARWVNELDLEPGLELREKMEEADCGVEMEVIVNCPNSSCGNVEKFDLPLGADFFRKRKVKKT